ncbi:MAG: glycine cleavage system aminomethyltransferase GcvT, partial [Pseudomonadota bacterium]
GVKAEHLWTRAHCSLFDVSHMGPCLLSLNDKSVSGDAAHAAISRIIEQRVPADIAALKPGQARLTVLLSDEGTILDDLIITRPQDEKDQGTLYIVVNGAVKEQDFALFEELAGDAAALRRLDEGHVLFALQGPEAEAVAADHFPGQDGLKFMRSHLILQPEGAGAISRCGYTGEDGFELLTPVDIGVETVRKLLADERVKPAGLGARDSLRLEAGLCLYGHDMDATRDPVEAGLGWTIQKTRRERGDFPGAARILKAIADGSETVRVGIRPLERAPAREGTEINLGGETVGIITSGGFGPTIDGPLAMGYIRADLAAPGTEIELMVRGKARPAVVSKLPFVEPKYKR